MKLCRFELNESPGTARSGVLHDEKMYETDGRNATAAHDLGKLALLPPIGRPPSVRVFDVHRDAVGNPKLSYDFLNPARIIGPAAELPSPEIARDLEIEPRVAMVLKDDGERVETGEAADLVLGYAVMNTFVAPQELAEEESAGLPPGRSKDVAFAIGPWLTTPEDLAEQRAGTTNESFVWSYRIRVNGEEIETGEARPEVSFAEMIHFASQGGPVLAGELLAGPKLPISPLSDSANGHGLLPGDRVDVEVAGLGLLVSRIV